jgi:chromosome segregation ATPase
MSDTLEELRADLEYVRGSRATIVDLFNQCSRDLAVERAAHKQTKQDAEGYRLDREAALQSVRDAEVMLRDAASRRDKMRLRAERAESALAKMTEERDVYQRDFESVCEQRDKYHEAWDRAERTVASLRRSVWRLHEQWAQRLWAHAIDCRNHCTNWCDVAGAQRWQREADRLSRLRTSLQRRVRNKSNGRAE